MKTLRLTMVLFFISIQLMAQVGVSFKVSGGTALPFGPTEFKDNYKMGINGGAGVIVSLLGILTVEGEADYNTFAIDTDKMLSSLGASGSGVTVSGGNFSVLSLMANLKLFLIPKISPLTVYVFGGAGMNSLKSAEMKVSYQGVSQTLAAETQSKAGIQLGAGVQFGVGSLAVFVEGKYVTAFTEGDNTSFVPVKAGLIFGL